MSLRNLLTQLPDASHQEVTEVLLKHPQCRLERIVSQGQASPAGHWYDQGEDEWVMVLSGEGTLMFGDGEEVLMQRGDSLLIPARRRHRVASTSTKEPTVWLALFVNDPAPIAHSE